MTTQSLGEIVTNYIREQIITGKFKPNRQIKEEEIASHFEISRPPVREAFSRLEAEGLVVKRPRKGIFVTEPTMEDVREIYLLKASLYELSVEQAIRVITDSQIRKLEKLVAKMNDYTEKEYFDILGYQYVHYKFHSEIMNIAGIERLTKFAQNLHNQVSRFSFKALQYREHTQVSKFYHNKIFQAIKSRDMVRSSQLTKEHVLDALDFQYSLYQSENLKDFDNSKIRELVY